MAATETTVPNHHAHYPGFAGLTGLLAAASMLGRDSDARIAERLTGLVAGDVVVDVGCGPGTAVRRAARRGASVVGVDPAPVMLRVARSITRNSDRVRFVEGRAESLPLPDSSASIVWSIACVHHWADLDAGLEEVRRILRAGGRLVAIERRSPLGANGLASHGWTDRQADAFADSCRAHGFTDIAIDMHRSGRRNTVSVTARARAG
jgi:ubiquinone/menaquinone biosynthesis C-methylase UbiE